MKAFIASCAVFLSLAVLAALAGSYSSRAADEILGVVRSLPPAGAAPGTETAARIERIKELWTERRRRLILWISRADAERVDSSVSALSAAARAGDAGDYAAALVRLSDALDFLSSS